VGRANFSTASFILPVDMRTAPTVGFLNFTGTGDFFTTVDDISYGNYGDVVVRGVTPRYVAIRATFQSGADASSQLYYQSGRALLFSAEL
jgi:hypothetical protein